MEIIQAGLLGVVQGLTEFLPVSSSAHLVIVESILGFDSPGVLFESVLHAGTLVSILYFYRNKIKKLTTGYLTLILIGTIPAVVVGLLIKDYIDLIFDSTLLVGFTLIITGLINFATDRQVAEKSKLPSRLDSLIIGTFQAFAILPGVSRSGSTILAARMRGIQKKQAAQFSFLLSIPAVLGANMLQIYQHGTRISGDYLPYITGFVCALVSGYCAIKFVIKYLEISKFKYFGYYAVVLGTTTVVLSLI